jgi:hypothetical protein
VLPEKRRRPSVLSRRFRQMQRICDQRKHARPRGAGLRSAFRDAAPEDRQKLRRCR